MFEPLLYVPAFTQKVFTTSTQDLPQKEPPSRNLQSQTCSIQLLSSTQLLLHKRQGTKPKLNHLYMRGMGTKTNYNHSHLYTRGIGTKPNLNHNHLYTRGIGTKLKLNHLYIKREEQSQTTITSILEGWTQTQNKEITILVIIINHKQHLVITIDHKQFFSQKQDPIDKIRYDSSSVRK